MKNFSKFLSEAKESQAVMKAKRLGLTSDGHGGWYDKRGEFSAKTAAGGLKFYNQNQVLGRQDPPQNRTTANQQPVATQSSPPTQTQTEPQTQEPLTQDKGILTVAFGRFNPPTTGHQKLLDTVAEIAGESGAYKIYPSRSQDPKKNPLDPDTKISLMRKMYPEHGEKIVNDENLKTIFDVLKKAYDEGYSGVNIVVGSDRQNEFEKLATKYNGIEYDFAELNVVSAGDRDPDSDDISGISASKLRKAAADEDFETFRKGTPKSLDDKETIKLFMMIRKEMGIDEEYNIWEIAPKEDMDGLRDSYINNMIYQENDLVENLNTGLIGKIIRRGTNYLICVTENNIMFKSWIKDVKEWTNQSGVPANQREVGTDALRKYTMKMTGTKKIDNFNIRNFINKLKRK